MKYSNNEFKYVMGVVLFLMLCLSLPCLAMPPHPDLIDKHLSGEKSLPSSMLKSKAELESRGINLASPLFSASKAAVSGSYKALVVLVEFPDKAATTSATYFDGLVFGSSIGTVADYYGTMSSGTLTIDSVDSPSGLASRVVCAT